MILNGLPVVSVHLMNRTPEPQKNGSSHGSNSGLAIGCPPHHHAGCHTNAHTLYTHSPLTSHALLFEFCFCLGQASSLSSNVKEKKKLQPDLAFVKSCLHHGVVCCWKVYDGVSPSNSTFERGSKY